VGLKVSPIHFGAPFYVLQVGPGRQISLNIRQLSKHPIHFDIKNITADKQAGKYKKEEFKTNKKMVVKFTYDCQNS
jgi:hypothetical protein